LRIDSGETSAIAHASTTAALARRIIRKGGLGNTGGEIL